ncbi:MAG: hypothetical protein R3F11_18685 [Verrucomicrobiales bacterium]
MTIRWRPDLGCGDGRFLLRMAAHFPERNFLGVERLLGRVRKVCRLAGERGLENLRVLRLESGYAIGWLPPAACADWSSTLLCPDLHSRSTGAAGFSKSRSSTPRAAF